MRLLVQGEFALEADWDNLTYFANELTFEAFTKLNQDGNLSRVIRNMGIPPPPRDPCRFAFHAS